MRLFRRQAPPCRECVAPRRTMTLQWHVTERCTLRCAHCYQEGPPAPELPLPGLLAILEQFRRLLASFHESPGAAPRGHITLTGGEPFLRADFPELLAAVAAAREWTGFSILTNGSAIDDTLARHLRRLDPAYVQLSLEGGEVAHDAIRGAGDFRRTLIAARRLVEAGVPTMLAFTAHRANWREFPAVAAAGRRLGVARVWADRLVPCGRGAGLESLTPPETRQFLKLMRRTRAAARLWPSRTEIAMHRALQFLAGGGRPYRCTAGDRLLALMPNGELYPCRRLPLRVGDVTQTPLPELYQSSPLLRALRDRSRPALGCEGCLHEGLCGGGLRCLAQALNGDPFTADPGCPHARSSRAPASSLIALPKENVLTHECC